MSHVQLHTCIYDTSDTVSAPSINRHFYINEGYYGCSGDLGWTLMVDGPGPCPMDWETSTKVYFVNTLSYSLMPGLTADFMAILVEREICNKESSSSPSNEFLSINETEEIQRRISSMKSNLTVPVNSTSQYIRTKTCAEDDRFSSRAIGTALGAGLISLLAALILFPDIKKVIYFSFQQLTAVCKRNDADKTHT
ncbi:uncharacterized protein LOC130048073 [Ostrea edulis]|uniref:uncharacterized protein LOC130048073 n=1 Tax=Ostrea edulis TaxID=37623 RepID=UPI0024AFCBB0|nr:uncharacterized protein LOC130048073 [Ostrea edulis]